MGERERERIRWKKDERRGGVGLIVDEYEVGIHPVLLTVHVVGL